MGTERDAGTVGLSRRAEVAPRLPRRRASRPPDGGWPAGSPLRPRGALPPTFADAHGGAAHSILGVTQPSQRPRRIAGPVLALTRRRSPAGPRRRRCRWSHGIAAVRPAAARWSVPPTGDDDDGNRLSSDFHTHPHLSLSLWSTLPTSINTSHVFLRPPFFFILLIKY